MWPSHWLGLDNASGHFYLFWSGVFGDATIFAAAVGIWWHHTCGKPTCFRPGRHPTADGLHKLCRKHHPDVPTKFTLEHIVAAHQAAQAESGTAPPAPQAG